MSSHHRRPLVVLLLVSGWQLAAVAGEKINFSEENRKEHELAAYSRAVSALPMDPKDGDQVRIWVMGYWSGRMPITGYIATAKGVHRCRLSYNNDNGEYLVINGGHCSGPRNYPERLARAMASLSELASYADKVTSCPVMDGWGADIEGLVDGKHFRFTAMNPDQCDEARPINEILELIQAAFYKEDKDSP